jgi:hypothetical protein
VTDILYVNVPTGIQGLQGYIYAAGAITSGYSDARLKNVISNIGNSLSRLSAIDGVYYTGNDIAKKYGYLDEDRHMGLLAQQVESVLPEAITPAPFDINSEGKSISGENYKTVRYDRIVALLIEVLKDQKTQIEYLKSKIKG